MPATPGLFGAPFALGANLPWVHYGGDFGANAWRPAGGLATGGIPPPLESTLYTVGQSGARILRWFLFCDGRSGIRFDVRGLPRALDAQVFADVDAALVLADR